MKENESSIRNIPERTAKTLCKNRGIAPEVIRLLKTVVVTWVSPAEAMLLIKLEAPLKNTKNEKTKVAANIGVLFLLRETHLLSSETKDRTAKIKGELLRILHEKEEKDEQEEQEAAEEKEKSAGFQNKIKNLIGGHPHDDSGV